MPSIIADFSNLHKASALPADLRTDVAYWAYIQRWFSAWAAMQGVDTWENNPFDEEGNPWPIITDPPMLVRANDNVWKAQCQACGKSGPVRRLNPLAICLDCWGAADGATVQWMRVDWPSDILPAERRLLRRPNPRHRNWHRQLPYAETLDSLVAEDAERGLP